VSHIGKENTVLRAKVQKEKVSVIPNAVDTALFTPDVSKRNNDFSKFRGLFPVVLGMYHSNCYNVTINFSYHSNNIAIGI